MASSAEMVIQQSADETLKLILSGSWMLTEARPSADEVTSRLETTPSLRRIVFDSQQITDWDSGLLTFIKRLRKACAGREVVVDGSGLPSGARQLLALAAAVPEKKDARKAEGRLPFLAVVGNETMDFFTSTAKMLEFIGEAALAFVRMLRGRALFRRVDMMMTIEACGGQALPIVSLISFLLRLESRGMEVISICFFARAKNSGRFFESAPCSFHEFINNG